ncbi:MAG: hypothetical protein PHG67_04370 [Bacteroidales bacterium]|jgi:hypothetical protein|nr:hypothetical protein [Bacteroidales bacterium]
MHKGLIIEIHLNKGYGFVKELMSGTIFRFNTAELTDPYRIHDQVFFNLIELEPGKLAVNLRKLSVVNQIIS